MSQSSRIKSETAQMQSTLPSEVDTSLEIPPERDVPCFGKAARLGSAPRGMPEDDDRVPDTILDGADLTSMSVRVASIRGDRHRYLSETRQDAASLSFVAEGIATRLLMCVADGMGSMPHSHVGAAMACRSLPVYVGEWFESLLDAEGRDEAVANVLTRVAQDLVTLAETRGLQAAELSTTLLAVLLPDSTADEQTALVLGVGDCQAVLLRDNEFTWIPGPPGCADDGLVDPSTPALPTKLSDMYHSTVQLCEGDILMLCTDGFGNLFRSPAAREWLATQWRPGQAPSILDFHRQVSLRIRTHDDDRSVAAVWMGSDEAH